MARSSYLVVLIIALNMDYHTGKRRQLFAVYIVEGLTLVSLLIGPPWRLEERSELHFPVVPIHKAAHCLHSKDLLKMAFKFIHGALN